MESLKTLLAIVLMWVAAVSAMEIPVNETKTAEEDLSTNYTETEDQEPSDKYFVPGCRYYCGWEGHAYCCDDGTIPLGPDFNHDPHYGLLCPPLEDQICKKSSLEIKAATENGIKSVKTTGSAILAKGNPKEMPVCASDGYCEEYEKCCPNKCASRHTCMRGLEAPTEELREEVPENDYYLDTETEEEGDYY